MDLFSDENGNVTFGKDLPKDCFSTPKKPKKKTKVTTSTNASTTSTTSTNSDNYVCQICGKSYIRQFNYHNHLRTVHSGHSSQDAPVNDDDIQLNDSDLSLVMINGSSNNQKDKQQTFKVPTAPKAKLSKQNQRQTKNELVCTYCLKRYVCSRSFKTHMRNHVMQDTASRFPDQEKILENISQISSAALTEVANCHSYGSNGAVFKQLIGHVVGLPAEELNDFSSGICLELVSSVCKRKTLLPSPLMSSLFDKMEEIVSDNNLCEQFLNLLHLDLFEPNVQAQFLMEFSLNFTLEIFKFIARTFRSGFNCTRVQNFQLDQEDKQVVFYIAGSIVRGYLKMAKRHSGNEKWQKIASVLKSNVLCSKPVGEIDSEWTAELDRGGLLYIQPPVQEFFKKVCVVVYSSEKRDGSIDYEDVISKVSNCDISVGWDDIIKDSLSEQVSVGLMNDVITSFCRTCGRGVAKRRLNFLRQKPLISMATRVSVARRKKK